jgi:hypothetical protein
MEDVIFDDAPAAVETAAPVEAEAPAVEAQEPVVEQQEQQQETEREAVRKKKSASERIQEITWARHEAERRAAEAERQLAEFRAAKQQEPAAPAGKPALDQFQDYDSYVEAVAEWRAGEAVRAALSEDKQKTQAAAQAAQNKQRTESWAKAQTAVRQALPDYDEVVGLSEVVVAPHVTDTILESDRGPEVAYYLAQHPEKAEQINGLSPIAAARAIGRIEASLPELPVAAAKISKAPAPIKPVSASSSAPIGISDDMSTEAYRAARAKQGAWWARKR